MSRYPANAGLGYFVRSRQKAGPETAQGAAGVDEIHDEDGQDDYKTPRCRAPRAYQTQNTNVRDSLSAPAPRISGFTTIIWAIVTKVVISTMTSCLSLVPGSESLKYCLHIIVISCRWLLALGAKAARSLRSPPNLDAVLNSEDPLLLA